MNRTCDMCLATYNDEFRSTICPHGTFAANNGRNEFAHHPESPLVKKVFHNPRCILQEWEQSGARCIWRDTSTGKFHFQDEAEQIDSTLYNSIEDAQAALTEYACHL